MSNKIHLALLGPQYGALVLHLVPLGPQYGAATPQRPGLMSPLFPHDMRSRTGGGLTMGRGFPIVISTKQKLNTQSSTESEPVGVDNMC